MIFSYVEEADKATDQALAAMPGRLFVHGDESGLGLLTRHTDLVSTRPATGSDTQRRKAIWAEFERLCSPTDQDWVLWLRPSEFCVGDLETLVLYAEACRHTGMSVPVYPVLDVTGFLKVGPVERSIRLFRYQPDTGFTKRVLPGPRYSHERTSHNITTLRILDFESVTSSSGDGVEWKGLVPKFR